MVATKEELVWFINAGLSSDEIGEIYGVSGRAVRYWLRRYGLETRVKYRGWMNVVLYRDKAVKISAENAKKRKQIVMKKCEFCGKEYVVRRPSLKDKSRFCSRKCVYAWMDTLEGELSWNYKGGGKGYKRLWARYKKARKEALERDGYKCVICGNTERLEVHHLNSFAYFEDMAFDPENMVTLCKKCHREFHKKYGQRLPVTRDMFMSFYMERTNNEVI